MNNEQLFPQHQQFQVTILEYYSQLQQLVQTMFKIFAYAFEVSLSELMSYFEQPTEVLRLTNYPAITSFYNQHSIDQYELQQDLQYEIQQQFGFAPHTDMALLRI